MKQKGYSFIEDSVDILCEPQSDTLFPRYNESHFPADKLKVLSLFSGCGGMDIGIEGGFICHKKSVPESSYIDEVINPDWVKLKETRFKTAFACDILPEARRAWVNYMSKRGTHPDIYHLESVVDLVKLHKEGVKIFPENVDIVTGGFPCQDFSVAGKRRGFDSHVSHDGKKNEEIPTQSLSRGKLYTWMKEVIEITRPKIFIAENVKGLVSLGDVKKIIQEDFSKAGGDGYFVLEPKVLNASMFGVPESRERVIFIGLRKDALKDEIREILEKEGNLPSDLNPYPPITHSDSENSKSPLVVCKDVLEFLGEPESSDDPSHKFYSKAKYLSNGSQGQTEINYLGLGPTIRAEHHGNIEFRRLSGENGGKNKDELSKGLQQRRLTPRECALIQTFPPDYNFVLYKATKSGYSVSPSVAYKIIGNAVPPLLAYNLSIRIESLWSKLFK